MILQMFHLIQVDCRHRFDGQLEKMARYRYCLGPRGEGMVGVVVCSHSYLAVPV